MNRRNWKHLVCLTAALIVISATLMGCGASNMSQPCTATAAIVPATASADHTLSPPGNQVQFTEQDTLTPPGCTPPPVQPGAVCAPNWTTSDATDTSVTNTGLATCINATPSPATIKQTCSFDGAVPTPAMLTCK